MLPIPKKELEEVISNFIKNIQSLSPGDDYRKILGKELVMDYSASDDTSYPTKKLEKIIKKHNLSFLGSGGSRLVLSYKNILAVKIDVFYEESKGDVFEGNKAELRNYKKIIKNYPEMTFSLAPIISVINLDNGHICLVMARMDKFFFKSFREKKDLGEFGEYLGDFDECCQFFFQDFFEKNIATFREFPYMIDFSHEKQRPTMEYVKGHYPKSQSLINRSLELVKKMKGMVK